MGRGGLTMSRRNDGRRQSRLTRRNVLKSVGAAGIAFSAANVVHANDPSPSDVFVVEGSVDDPVTQGQKDAAVRAAVDSFADRGGDPGAEVGMTEAESRTGNPLVAFGVRLDEHGKPSTYHGFAADERAAARRYDRLAELKQRWRSGRQTDSDVGTMGWSQEGDAYSDDSSYPYGEVTLYTVYYEYNNNRLFETNTGMVPGTNIWSDSSHGNDRTVLYHNWGTSQLNSVDLASWEKSGYDCGSHSWGVSLDATGPTFSWTYSQADVCKYDNTNTQDDLVYLAWDDYSGGARGSSVNYDMGSEAWTSGPSSCDTWRIGSTESHGRFEHWGDSEWVGTVQHHWSYTC